MKHIILISAACISTSHLHAQANADTARTFSTPGIIKVNYPANFIVTSNTTNQAVTNYAKQFLNKANLAPDASFDQTTILLNAYTQEQGEYAHLNVTLGPPEISQEDLIAANDEQINQLTDAMAIQIKEGFAKGGIELVDDFTGKKEDLTGGIKCFTLKFSYKKNDGAVRINTKRYIYTKRHTVVIGVAASPGYSKENRKQLEMIASSIIASDD